MARSLAYVVGLVGVIGGVVVYRSGGVPLAVAVWVITFAGGAVLMIAGFLCDGLAALLARTAAIEQQLSGRRGIDDTPDDWQGHPNPW